MQIKSRGLWLFLPTLWISSFVFAQQPREVQVTATDFSFKPPKILVPQGEVTITVTNRGKFPHALAIVGRQEKISYIESGENQSTTVRFDQPGEIAFYCSQPGHRKKGMEGKFSIEEK